MAKLAALNLDGTLDRGVAVTLEISAEGHPFHTRIPGHLPPSPELLYTLNQWQETYLRLGGDFRIKIKSVESGAIQRQKCDRMSDALREQFITWLRADSLRALNEQILEELRREEPVRVLIRTQDPLLRRLPWHEWDLFGRYPLAEYALSSPNAKRIQKIESTKSKKAVKVLAILGNDDGIDTQTDRQLLNSLGNVEFLVKPNRQTINDQLWSQPWDILFFAGHSETEGNTGRIYINSTDYLTIEQLKYGLQQAIANGLQLAIFNSCDGLGLATALEHLHIPQLIIMREPVPDRVAQTFLRYFLTAYAGGKSLYLAEREAREKLHGMEDEFPCASWLPVIVQNSAEVPPTWQSLRRGGRIAGDVWRKRSQVPRGMTIGGVLQTSALITLLVMGVRTLGWLESVELLAYDYTMRSRPATDDLVDPNILV
ncbi:MAG TPA: CHAT domain-containing protein, partial [Cyanophyceae cyanobacterium]